ncbi:hypothetical protein, partial [Mesorhizobium sp. Root552]|uniref:hypothetical protein n=1 Tax=Mesorhizobium sp. Root552 TaxID=1736555 RepID=UPI001AEC05BD
LCLIFAPLKGYNEPEILRSRLNRFGPISADAGQHAGSFPMTGRNASSKKDARRQWSISMDDLTEL